MALANRVCKMLLRISLFAYCNKILNNQTDHDKAEFMYLIDLGFAQSLLEYLPNYVMKLVELSSLVLCLLQGVTLNSYFTHIL